MLQAAGGSRRPLPGARPRPACASCRRASGATVDANREVPITLWRNCSMRGGAVCVRVGDAGATQSSWAACAGAAMAGAGWRAAQTAMARRRQRRVRDQQHHVPGVDGAASDVDAAPCSPLPWHGAASGNVSRGKNATTAAGPPPPPRRRVCPLPRGGVRRQPGALAARNEQGRRCAAGRSGLLPSPP